MTDPFASTDPLADEVARQPQARFAALDRVGMRGIEMPVRANLGIFTQPFSFIGLPVAAIPIDVPGQKLPLGLQAIAAPWREDFALRVARQLEKAGIAKAPVARGFAEE